MTSKSIKLYSDASNIIFQDCDLAEEWLDDYSTLLTNEVETIDEAMGYIISIINENL
jgi:hypothetical protein